MIRSAKRQSHRNGDSNFLIIPAVPFFVLALGYLLLGCGAFFLPGLYMVWLFVGAGLIPIVLFDLIAAIFFTDWLEADRELPSSLAQGEAAEVRLYIRRKSPVALLPASILLYDLYPDSMKTNAFPAKLDRKLLAEQGELIFEYSLYPLDRGRWAFLSLHLLLGSPLRLWRIRVTHKITSQGRTYPNFKKLKEGQELHGLLERGEIREIRKRGQGMEFESLRDYQEGDSIRSIDWRASSRVRRLDNSPKLIVRDYQEEQEQQVLFIIDSGYRLPDYQFDSALNATLLLSYVALKHGDAVAAAAFGASERWIPPRKGMSALTGLMNGLYDLHSSPVPSSIFSALENALSRLHRRTFIILISNFQSEDGESLSWILSQIKRRHLLLMVSFRESESASFQAASFQGASFQAGPFQGGAFQAASSQGAFSNTTPVATASAEQTLETAAAFSYLASRRRMYREWEHSGLLVLETTAPHISAALINRYLSVKRSGKL